MILDINSACAWLDNWINEPEQKFNCTLGIDSKQDILYLISFSIYLKSLLKFVFSLSVQLFIILFLMII